MPSDGLGAGAMLICVYGRARWYIHHVVVEEGRNGFLTLYTAEHKTSAIGARRERCHGCKGSSSKFECPKKIQQKLLSPKTTKDLKAAVQTVSGLQLSKLPLSMSNSRLRSKRCCNCSNLRVTRQTRAWALRRSLFSLKSSAVVH